MVARLPAGPFAGLVLANELLDNLPFRLLQRTGAPGWAEVFVDAALAEVLIPVGRATEADADRLAPAATEGSRIPLQEDAGRWVSTALERVESGRVVAFDYCDTTSSMAERPWTDWVRTYRAHGRSGHPLADLGEADVTCEVALDQLPPPSSDRTQADFLVAHGLRDLESDARREWEERAHCGDLRALTARSRAWEARALSDPSGLGGFRALEWEVPDRLGRHG